MHFLLRALLCFILAAGSLLDLHAQMPTPSPAEPLFKERPFGPLPPPTSTPVRKAEPEPEEPIPLNWLIGGTAAAVLAIGLVLFLAARRWHSSNLFDRQYRFPVVRDPALRFGAKKCGGHLARVEFGRAGLERSETKEA